MLKDEIKNKIVQEISLEKVENDTIINDKFIKDISSIVDISYDRNKSSNDNIENNLVLYNKDNLGATFFMSDVYDDFEGKNPKMTIYNSHEMNRNLVFREKEKELTVQEVAEKFYYNFKNCLTRNDVIFLNSSGKKFLLCVMLAIENFTIIFLNIFLALFFSVIAYLYLAFFKIYKYLYGLFNKKYMFFLHPLLYIFIWIIKYILILIKTFANTIYRLFNPLNSFTKTITNIKRDFFFDRDEERSKVNRRNRSKEQIFLINAVSKKSRDKMRQMAKHNLEYLKQFKIQEFVMGYVNYQDLPEGQEKEYYKNIELTEKKNIMIEIVKRASKVQNKRMTKGIKTIVKIDNLIEKFPRNKISENITTEDKELYGKLSDAQKTVNAITETQQGM
jgi:hypothetical protein